MLRVNEERRAFSCIGYLIASAVAGPHGPVFLPMAILEARRVYINRPSAMEEMKRDIWD